MAESVTVRLMPYDGPVEFRLQRKAEAFGRLEIDHWWLPIPTVYPPASGGPPANYRAVLDAYWQLCRREGSDGEPDVAESYLLARLLPHARRVGGNRVVADGRPRPRGRGRPAEPPALEEMLRGGHFDPVSEVEFRDRTADALGPGPLDGEAIDRYRRFCEDLFDGPTRMLAADPDAACAALTATWQRWARGFGRRRGRDGDKRVLDVLSYEARAALHRCYSAAWAHLILPHLRERHGLPAGSARFLEFWHLEQSRESSPGDPAYFHLFHGHAFGLHPTGSAFVGTQAGKELLGEWLAAGPEHLDRAYRRLLGGLLVAVFHYATERTEDAGRRAGPGRGRTADPADLPAPPATDPDD